MNNKILRRYFKKEWKLMQAHLEAFITAKEQEDLHEFRVQVKKLKALLILTDQSASSVPLIHFLKPVRKIFRLGGTLRNAYVSDKLTGHNLCKDNVLVDFCSLVKKRQRSIRRSYNVIKKKLRRVGGKSVREFYESQLRRIARDLSSQPSAMQLHDCRKWIKVLLYNYQVAHDDLAFSLNTAYLDQLQEEIGDWHDRCLAGEIIPEFSASSAGNFYERAVYSADKEHVLS